MLRLLLNSLYVIVLGLCLYLIIGILARAYIFATMGRYKINKSLKGKVVIMTGGTAGIGKAAVQELAAHGATVIVLARDMKKAHRVLGEIKRKSGNNAIVAHQADLNNFESIRTFAREFLATKRPIHILINNAGLTCSTKRTTMDGYEETIQANHLGHFLLTNLLIDRLIESGPSRIVNVSSAAHVLVGQEFDVFDINFKKQSNKWGITKAYCWSKLMNILFTRELAWRLRGTNVTVNCLNPGAVRTEQTREGKWTNPMVAFIRICSPFMRSISEGIYTTLYLATSDDLEHISGHFFSDCKPAATSVLATDHRLAESLWTESQRLTGLANSKSYLSH